MTRLAWRPADLARDTGRSVATIFRAIRRGDLAARRIGSATVIPADAAHAWTARATARTATPDTKTPT